MARADADVDGDRRIDWLFPLLEGSHILALPLSVGMIVIFDLHLLGLALVGSRAGRVMHAMLHWRADGKEVFWRGLNLESNELLLMSVDVTPTPTFSVGTPKLLFKLPGPIGGNLGNISRDGQRFVFAVNVSAAATTVC